MNNFTHMIESASMQKQRFDYSVKNLKSDLADAVSSKKANNENEIRMAVPETCTGWLRGSLSYPWAIVFIVIPAIMDMM